MNHQPSSPGLNTVPHMQTDPQHQAAENIQLLTFHLAGDLYGIDILHIREIRALSPVTALPGSPAYLKGIMNLRGAIIPVIDLRIRLGLPALTSPNRFAVTIVTQVGGKHIGVAADAVNEVVTVPTSAIQKPPAANEHGDQRFVKGIVLRAAGRSGQDCRQQDPGAESSQGTGPEMVVVLDLERVYDPAIDGVPAPAAPAPLPPDSLAALAAGVSEPADNFASAPSGLLAPRERNWESDATPFAVLEPAAPVEAGPFQGRGDIGEMP